MRRHRPVEHDRPLPCVYWMHGGGYVLGSANKEDQIERWCPEFDCVGVSVEYRLAPEHPYPIPLDDCYAGVRWVHDHATELGIDLTEVPFRPDETVRRTSEHGCSCTRSAPRIPSKARWAPARAEVPILSAVLVYFPRK